MDHDGVGDDVNTVILNWEDRTSAVRFTNNACKKSLVGKALGRLFCTMLIDSPLGVNAKWLSTSVNVIADGISRVKKDSSDSNFDHLSLKLKYPLLRYLAVSKSKHYSQAKRLPNLPFSLLFSKLTT